MALAQDVAALRDRTLADLNAAHDYHTDTKIAWDIVRRSIAGRRLSIRNKTTGTVTTQRDLVGRSRGYVAKQLAEATFQQFIAIFENYFFDFLRLWLTAYPGSLAGKRLEFKDVLGAADKEAIIARVVSKEVNEILYDRPAGWFEYLEGKAKLVVRHVWIDG